MPPWWGLGWGWRRGWRGPWPGNGPWSFLPPWERPGWYFGGRGACWRVFGAPGWVVWGRYWWPTYWGRWYSYYAPYYAGTWYPTPWYGWWP